VRVLSVRSGEARLALATGERVVRVGDRVGTDVVRSIEPGRIVLIRPGPPEATVVVSFDGPGPGRIRVLSMSLSDPGAAPR
jgi:hypothetical protein